MILGLVFITIFAFTQNSRKVEKLAEKMAGEICDCMCSETDFQDVDKTNEVFMNCFMKSLGANKKEIKKRVMKHERDFTKTDAMYNFGLSIGMNLGLSCDKFLSFVMSNMDENNKYGNHSGDYGIY